MAVTTGFKPASFSSTGRHLIVRLRDRKSHPVSEVTTGGDFRPRTSWILVAEPEPASGDLLVMSQVRLYFSISASHYTSNCKQ